MAMLQPSMVAFNELATFEPCTLIAYSRWIKVCVR
jgi:hypothetical protein